MYVDCHAHQQAFKNKIDHEIVYEIDQEIVYENDQEIDIRTRNRLLGERPQHASFVSNGVPYMTGWGRDYIAPRASTGWVGGGRRASEVGNRLLGVGKRRDCDVHCCP